MIVILELVYTKVHTQFPQIVLVTSAYHRIYSQSNNTMLGMQQMTATCWYWDEKWTTITLKRRPDRIISRNPHLAFFSLKFTITQNVIVVTVVVLWWYWWRWWSLSWVEPRTKYPIWSKRCWLRASCYVWVMITSIEYRDTGLLGVWQQV